MAIVPIMVDIDAAVAEIRRAHASGLRGGILIPPMWQPHEPYHHPRYDPVWAVCEELSMPVHTHSGVADRAVLRARTSASSPPRPGSGRRVRCRSSSGRACSSASPALRFGVAECGAFWVNDLLWRMDLVYERDHGSRKLGAQLTANMSMSPSEYFDRNCFIGASNIVRVEMARRYEIGVGNLCWGNDFPHPEGTWPHTREFLAQVFCDIPRDETAAMLGGNAAEVYGFDVDALAPLVDRIGPTPEELGQRRRPDGQVGRRQAGRATVAHRHRDVADRHPAVVTTTTGPAPFDPLDPAFVASPYEAYAAAARRGPGPLVRAAVGLGRDPLRRRGRDPARPVDVERHRQGDAQPDHRAWRSRAWPSTARRRRRSCTSTIPTTPGCAS